METEALVKELRAKAMNLDTLYPKQSAYWRAAAHIETLSSALKEIADSDDIDNLLDPERNKRVARAALQGGRSITESDR